MSGSFVKSVIIGGIAFIVIGLTMAFGPAMLAGFESTRTDTNPYTQVYLATPGPSGSANQSLITFTYPLLVAGVSEVTSITSNGTETLTIVASTLTTTSSNITGHTSQTPRQMTVTYNYGTNQFYTGLGSTLTMGPTLVLLGFIIAVGVVGFMGIRVINR